MIVAQVLYLLAPAVLAGVVHALVLKRNLFAQLARPLDGGRTWRGRPLLGANKTWRGPFVMVAGCTAGVLVQRALGIERLALVESAAFGPALGLAYSLAELPNSFAKRRLGIRAGGTSRRPLQYVADQCDSAAGAAVVTALFVPEAPVVALVLVLGFALHALFDRLLYACHVKRRPPLQGVMS